MKEAKASLLIVEDDLDISEMLDSYFRMQGYGVTVVNWGEDGVGMALTQMPDLVILDIRLPDIDGFEVARRLRANRKTQNIPIIFLTEKRERADRLQGLSLKAEDYITKPFDVQELRLRVLNVLERTRRAAISDHITGLPEGAPVDDQLTKCLQSPGFCISVISLRNMGRFREVYGFVASDDLMRAVSLMLQDVVRGHGSPDLFLGHLNPNAFLLITRSSDADDLKQQIARRVGPSLDYFYRDQDRDTELFRGHRLSVELQDYMPDGKQVQDVGQFRTELEKLVR